MGHTRTKLTDDEMENTFQKDYLEKLLSWNKKVKQLLERKKADSAGNTEKIDSYIKSTDAHTAYLDNLMKKLDIEQVLSSEEIDGLSEEIKRYNTTITSIDTDEIKLYIPHIQSGDPLRSCIDPGILYGANGIELLAVRRSIIGEYNKRDTHPLRTEALRFLHHELLGENGEIKKSALMKSIIASENLQSESSSNRAMTFLKSHFSTSRHHPEIRVIRLLSQFKEGANDPRVAKHNSELLKQINAICDKVTDDPKCKSSDTAKNLLYEIRDFATNSLSSNSGGMNSEKLDTLCKKTQSRINNILPSKVEKPNLSTTGFTNR